MALIGVPCGCATELVAAAALVALAVLLGSRSVLLVVVAAVALGAAVVLGAGTLLVVAKVGVGLKRSWYSSEAWTVKALPMPSTTKSAINPVVDGLTLPPKLVSRCQVVPFLSCSSLLS